MTFSAIDLFAGAGGTSTGLALAAAAIGRSLALAAVNHWETAVATHAANHPWAAHHCAAIDSLDPRKVARGRVDLLVEPFLVRYQGTSGAESIDRPVSTITTRDRLGLVEPQVLDIRFRMLQPHELAAAMSFPAGYRFAGTKTEQVKQIGNAVAVRTAQALCAAILREVAA